MKYKLIRRIIFCLAFLNIQFIALAQVPDPNFHIYLCFGQSNMEGQGPIETQDQTVDSRFQIFQSLDCTGQPKEKWRTATPPLCRCNTKLGPADYFGREMINNLPSNIKVGIVHVAIAGCKIELFDKNNYSTYVNSLTASDQWMKDIINLYGGNPYARLVQLAKLAQKDGVIKGILMHQGESNSGEATWPGKVKGVYDNLITDLGLNAANVPLLVGQVVDAAQGGACAAHNTIINAIPNTIPTAHVISSSGCTDQSDNLHFTSAGYRILGARYAQMMLTLLPPTNTAPSITTNLSNTTIEQNKTLTLTIGADGSNLTYVWYRNNQVISGATTATLTMNNVDASYDNSTFKVVVSNSLGTVTSNTITLTVTDFLGVKIVKTGTAVTIDGTVDAAWANSNEYLLKNKILTVDNDADLSGKVKILYDNQFLYVMYTITDNQKRASSTNFWENDGVELYIDGNNDKATSYDANDFQFVFRYDASQIQEGHSKSVTGITAKATQNTTGYVLEASIPWTLIGITPTVNKNIGIDFHANDSDLALRDGKMTWFATQDNSYSDPSTFGTGRLENTTITNTLPTVSITAPANNATYITPSSIVLTATASDADGTVNKVEFFNGTTLLGSSTAAPYSYTWTNTAVGAYTITAKATDDKGGVNTSTPITLNIVANQLPTVSISAPANNVNYILPSNIVLTASASDADGTVNKVEFFNGTTLLGSSTTSPYSYTWTNATVGVYTITAKATDDKGGVTTSTAITVNIKANQLPTVSIAAPANNANYITPASIAFIANATDADGTVSKVEFFNGTTLLGSSTAAPYSYTWTNPGVGVYTITAKATDDKGGVNTSTAITVNVKANQLPAVSITSPANNVNYISPANIVLTATATDADGTVSKVEFFNGTTLLGSSTTAPYTYTWTNATVGVYSITAKATDDKVGVTTSTTITVNVKTNQLPAVSITAPANIANYISLANIVLTATATDADGTVSKVEFFNGTTLLGSSTTAPYTYTWTSPAVGVYTITAKATDDKGGVTTSTAITVNVAGNQLPTVSITNPANNTIYTATASSIVFTATASDADGSVSKVEFFNGTTLLGSSATAPYSYTWTNVPAGSYNITAKATDDKNGVTTSTAITVIINQAPVISITSPTSGASLVGPANITINASASDADGTVSKVDFYNGSTLLGTDNTSPFSFNWNGVGGGSYSISAKAIDNNSATTTSASVNIVVTGNQASVVSINSPTSNATFNSNASVVINVSATDPDGSITKVEYFDGTTLVGTSTTAPYTFNWSSSVIGAHVLTAKVTDSNGGVTTSAPVTVNIKTPNQAPYVAISSPVAGAIFVNTAPITITAGAADVDGTVSKVDFYNGSILIGSDNTSPFSFNWTGVGVGTYNLTAKATDNGGEVTTSDAISITVNANQPSVITISSPINNATYTTTQPVFFSINATDPDGAITLVEYYDGNTLIGSSTNAPYNFNWNSAPAGTHTITIKVKDSFGGVTTANVNVIVNTPNALPSITITSPASIVEFNTTESITLQVNTSDADGSITKVEFYNGNTLLGTANSSPYSYTLSNVPAGEYTITAVATDNQGGVTTSSPVTAKVNLVSGLFGGNYSYGASGNLYPNPSSSSFTLKVSEEIRSLVIQNMYGATIDSKENITASQNFDLGLELEAGTYVMQILYVSGKTEVHKFIKIK